MGVEADKRQDLVFTMPNGQPFSRLDMERQLKSAWKKLYWMKQGANDLYGLPKVAAWDMVPVFLRHWLLDEMVRRGQITGDLAGVNQTNYNDENEKRQFTQRLMALIQSGQALQPEEGEGIDMSNMQPPPGPGAPNGQNGFTPPPPPMGVPQGFAPPPQQQFAPPQGFPPQPQQFQPPAPQGVPPGYPPPQPQQQYVPPQAPQQMPVQAAPMMPPGYGQNQPAPPMSLPQQAAPAPGPGRGRGRKPAAETQQSAAPVVNQGPVLVPSSPQPFAPNPAPQAPIAFANPVPIGHQQQSVPSNEKLEAQVARLEQAVANMARSVLITNAALEVYLRSQYNKAGTPGLDNLLRDLGIAVPQ